MCELYIVRVDVINCNSFSTVGGKAGDESTEAQ